MLTKIKYLEGFSGCKIILYYEEGIYFVRKISKSLEYNERLRSQMLKQKFFLENLANNKITTPKVLRSGYIGELFFFDMEYIQGTDLISYIIDSDKEGLSEISGNFSSIISLMKRSQRKDEIENLNEKIIKKIEEIQSNTLHAEANFLLDELKKLALNLESKDICQTFCHGDLTTENIIYAPKKDKYYLIDFLDNFIEHYWFDITKIFQDIEGNWYKFRNPSINLNNTLPKMRFIHNLLYENLIKFEDFYKQNHHLFLALNFARILPYTQEAGKQYIKEIIRQNLNKFKEKID